MTTFERFVAAILLVSSVTGLTLLLTSDHPFRRAAFPVMHSIVVVLSIITIAATVFYYVYLYCSIRKEKND